MAGRRAWVLMVGVMLSAAAMAAAPGVSAADGTCGSKANPCPLQKWMRQNIAAANASGDMVALEAALTKAAAFAPDPSWNGKDPKASWDAISTAGAAAAKANDVAAVKQACKACHDSFKEKYKLHFRTRAVP